MDSLSVPDMIKALENQICRFLQARRALTDDPLPDYVLRITEEASGVVAAASTAKTRTKPPVPSVAPKATASAPDEDAAVNSSVERPKRTMSEEARRKISEGMRRRHELRRAGTTNAA